MQLLLAEDDPILANGLTAQLKAAGFTVEHAPNGPVAEYLLTRQNFDIAIIDLGLPMVDGLTVLKNLRATRPDLPVLVLTALDRLDSRVAGLNAGADDYMTKPFNWDELRARLRIGNRIVGLQQTLAARVNELQQALGNVKRLSGLLPICAYCKRIRNNQDYWMQVERYLAEHSEAEFSHGICPECLHTQLSLDQS